MSLLCLCFTENKTEIIFPFETHGNMQQAVLKM